MLKSMLMWWNYHATMCIMHEFNGINVYHVIVEGNFYRCQTKRVCSTLDFTFSIDAGGCFLYGGRTASHLTGMLPLLVCTLLTMSIAAVEKTATAYSTYINKFDAIQIDTFPPNSILATESLKFFPSIECLLKSGKLCRDTDWWELHQPTKMTRFHTSAKFNGFPRLICAHSS